MKSHSIIILKNLKQIIFQNFIKIIFKIKLITQRLTKIILKDKLIFRKLIKIIFKRLTKIIIKGLSQNNNPGPIQNNIHLNGNEKINKKMKSLKTIFLIILVIIFISEIVVDFIALPTFSKKKPHAEDEDYYFGEGLKVFAFLFFYYPILIILSSIILWLSCYEDYPIIKIVASIIMCFIRGFIITRFINDYNNKTEIFTIVLLIFNCIFMITSISYQIIIKINLKLSC